MGAFLLLYIHGNIGGRMVELYVHPVGFEFAEKCLICDGFVLGEKNKGLRLSHSFTHEEIIKLIDLCQKRRQKVIISVNQIIHEHKLDEFYNYMEELSRLDVDGIMFGDLDRKSVV